VHQQQRLPLPLHFVVERHAVVREGLPSGFIVSVGDGGGSGQRCRGGGSALTRAGEAARSVPRLVRMEKQLRSCHVASGSEHKGSVNS